MADNVAITPGSGATIACDEVVDGTLGTAKVQYVKIMDGTLDGTAKATVNATGLKVDASGAAVPITDNSGSLTVDNAAFSATGSTVPASAAYQGLDAATALPSAATAGNLVGAMSDKFGRQIVLPVTVRDLVGTQTTTISASTSETTIITAGGAGIFNDLICLIISNTSASTNTRVDIRDATAGSVIASVQSIGGAAPVGIPYMGTPIPQTTAANNWTAQCGTSTTDIRVFAVYAKNK